MKTIKLDAYAKINLSLDVLNRRKDGYHELSMIMQQISLKDIVTITEKASDTSIEIKCNRESVPTDKTNIAYKAAELVKETYKKSTGLVIDIEKNIPVSGGLAGGSTNASAVLKGLNEIWDLNLGENELMDLGLKLGADVPFCIMGGTALAEGIGEKLIKLKCFKDKHILLVNPNREVSTADVYKGLDIGNLKKRPDIGLVISAIEENDEEKLAKNMKNVLESVTIKEIPVIDDIKQKMIDLGALGSLMSGSGATVFGIFKTREQLEICKKEMEKEFKTTLSALTI